MTKSVIFTESHRYIYIYINACTTRVSNLYIVLSIIIRAIQFTEIAIRSNVSNWKNARQLLVKTQLYKIVMENRG